MEMSVTILLNLYPAWPSKLHHMFFCIHVLLLYVPVLEFFLGFKIPVGLQGGQGPKSVTMPV